MDTQREYLIERIIASGAITDEALIPDFDSWEGFGFLFLWASNQPWWTEFASDELIDELSVILFTRMINPQQFQKDLYEFL